MSEPQKSISISLYPNPTNGSIYYVINDKATYSYTITDIAGRLIKTGNMSMQVNEIDLSNFEKGMYLITVSNENYIQTDRIILQ